MREHAAITVNRSREEVERLWRSSEHRPSSIDGADAAVHFVEGAPAKPWWAYTAERKRTLAARAKRTRHR